MVLLTATLVAPGAAAAAARVREYTQVFTTYPFSDPNPVPVPGRNTRGFPQRILLAGDVPSPTNPPPGCAFHTRCRHAQPRCRTDVPALSEDAGHAVACHLWREIETPPTAHAAAGPANHRLQRLQSAFIT